MSFPVIAALLSGVLLALSFPRYGHPVLAFIALAPLWVALSGWQGRPGELRGVSVGRAVRLGLLTGGLHFAGTVYWTGATVQTFGGLPLPVAVIVAALLVVFMSLYVGAAAASAGLLISRFGVTGVWLAPCAWVSFEYLRGHLFGGFPWIPLGNAMVTLLPVAQLASVTGVYGLSFFVALVNAGVAVAMMTAGRTRILSATAVVTLVTTVSIYGGMRLSANTLIKDGTPITVGLVQGNVLQIEKWNPARAGMILNRYLDMTRQVVAGGAQLVVWPESSTPFYFEEDAQGGAAIRSVVQATGTPLLLGSDEIEREGGTKYYNAAFMLDRGGATAAVYRKIHLVPFGEFVPMQKWLFFVSPLVEAVSDFSAGAYVTMLPIRGHMMSTAICYEVTYPELMRDAVLQGSELLSTITNDAWYGESSAPYQHFEMAAMRAIEQGRYLIRAANTGITGIVDPYGRVVARTKLFETTSVVGDARFVHATTLYARIGDCVPQAAAGITALAVLAALIGRRRRRAAA